MIIKYRYPSLFLKLKWDRIYLPNISPVFPFLFNFFVLKVAQNWSCEDVREESH